MHISAWLGRLPHRVALAVGAVLVLVGGIYIATTPACAVRQLPFDISYDRSHECGENGAQKRPKGSNRADTPEQGTSFTRTAALAQRRDHHVKLSFAKDGVRELRRINRLSIVDGASEAFGETPAGTYGFFYAGSFATVWKTGIAQLTIRNAVHDIYFEGQKHSDGMFYVVGYVRGDVAESLGQSDDPPAKLKISSQRYRRTDAVIAIPLSLIRSVGQSEVTFGAGGIIPVLEIGILSI